MLDKLVRSTAEWPARVADGAAVLMPGFREVGAPLTRLDGLIEQGATNLASSSTPPAARHAQAGRRAAARASPNSAASGA